MAGAAQFSAQARRRIGYSQFKSRNGFGFFANMEDVEVVTLRCGDRYRQMVHAGSVLLACRSQRVWIPEMSETA